MADGIHYTYYKHEVRGVLGFRFFRVASTGQLDERSGGQWVKRGDTGLGGPGPTNKKADGSELTEQDILNIVG